MSNNMMANREYMKRPADERFATPEAMLLNAQEDRATSRESTRNLKDFKVVAKEDRVMLQSPTGTEADFTHFAFGQFARTLGAPANYLRSLPPHIAAQAMNYGIDTSEVGTRINALVRNPNRAKGETAPVIRAATSDTYGRLWDADLYGALLRNLAHDKRWHLPPTWDGKPAGAYRGDRDSFLILVDGGSMVTDPTINPSRTPNASDGTPANGMYRAIMARNSEVGGGSVDLFEVLFRVICGNHILWGAVVDKAFKRRHTGKRVLMDTMREVLTMAKRVSTRSAAADEQLIRDLARYEIANTKDGVVDELRAMGFTKEQATKAYEAGELFEANPRSAWGLAQGVTRISQENGFQDERFSLDKLASQLLIKARAKVAA